MPRRLAHSPNGRVGACFVASALFAVACSGGGGADRADDRIVGSGDESVFDLAAGDCLDPPEAVDEQVGDLPAVPCWEPHTHEVIGTFEIGTDEPFTGASELDGEVYPGAGQLGDWADRACIAAYPEYVGADYFDSDLFVTYLLPTIDSWSKQSSPDRTVVCLVRTTGWPMQRSVHCSGGLRGTFESPGEKATDLESAYPVLPGDECPTTDTLTEG